MLGPQDSSICKTCSRPLPKHALVYCRTSCSQAARRERDRDRKRIKRVAKPAKAADEFVERDAPSKKLPDIQPRALVLVQARAAEFARWVGEDLTDLASRFCFMRGYSELDRVEIVKCLRGEIKTAPEEIPPDPPPDVDTDPWLQDPFAD